MKLRSMLYKLARLLGDAHAFAHGRFVQRLARKQLYRRAGSAIGRWLP